jgi:hypothetical protein
MSKKRVVDGDGNGREDFVRAYFAIESTSPRLVPPKVIASCDESSSSPRSLRSVRRALSFAWLKITSVKAAATPAEDLEAVTAVQASGALVVAVDSAAE